MARNHTKAPGQRQLRVGEEIRHVLARIFERGTLRDPALTDVRLTVTEVRPSADLRHARVYVVPLGGGAMDGILEGLKRVRPYLRREMAGQLQMKFIPDLSFAADNSFDEAAHILTLLHKPEVARDLRDEDGDEQADVADKTDGLEAGGQPIHGWIAVDKPAGITAATVVARVKRALDAAKVGHGGTLDPLATGILPIALGEATKTVSFAMDGAKTYRFQVTWGAATTTDDSDGTVTTTSPHRPTEAAVRAALPAFIGTISQVPPIYSAIKIDGERAYARARRDEAVVLAARPVQIADFRLNGLSDADHATFEVDCGKGTYVRALVRDLAQALGTVGHISELRRTRCGTFRELGAISLEMLETLGHKAAQSAYLLPVATVLDDIPALALTAEEARRVSLGQAIALWPVAKRSPLSGLTPGMAVQAKCGDKLIAVAEVGDGMVRPVRVMNH